MTGTVLVAGATGRAGAHIVRRLVKAGIDTRGMARSKDRVESLGLPEEACFEADALRTDTLEEPFEGVDIVISTVGLDPVKLSGRLRFEEGDLQANRNLLDAAKGAKVRRFVYLSVFGDPDLDKTAYIKVHRQFEKELTASGLETIIVRPTGFFSSFSSMRGMALKRGRVPVIGNGASKSNPVHEADVAEACVRGALELEAPGQIDIGGPEIFTRKQIAEIVFAGTGKKPKTMRTPATLLKAARYPARLLNPHTADVLEFALTVSNVYAVAPAIGKRKLGDYFFEPAL